MTSKRVKIRGPFGTVSGLLDIPREVLAGITLAHGAGAGMHHPFLMKLALSLVSAKFAILRFQFPYMEGAKGRPDSPKIATATIASATEMLRKEMSEPVFAGGKSFGARMTTTAASEGLLSGVKGILCFGFPLHSAREPSTERANHLVRLPIPTLFLQGTRDSLAEARLMRSVCSKLPNATLRMIEGADHGFNVLKNSGRTPEEVIEELSKEAEKFLRNHL